MRWMAPPLSWRMSKLNPSCCTNFITSLESPSSMLTATTAKPGPPSFRCSRSRDGISTRHGGHQVAHTLSRITLSRSEEHTSELQSPCNLVCRLLLEKKKH